MNDDIVLVEVEVEVGEDGEVSIEPALNAPDAASIASAAVEIEGSVPRIEELPSDDDEEDAQNTEPPAAGPGKRAELTLVQYTDLYAAVRLEEGERKCSSYFPTCHSPLLVHVSRIPCFDDGRLFRRSGRHQQR